MNSGLRCCSVAIPQKCNAFSLRRDVIRPIASAIREEVSCGPRHIFLVSFWTGVPKASSQPLRKQKEYVYVCVLVESGCSTILERATRNEWKPKAKIATRVERQERRRMKSVCRCCCCSKRCLACCTSCSLFTARLTPALSAFRNSLRRVHPESISCCRFPFMTNCQPTFTSHI